MVFSFLTKHKKASLIAFFAVILCSYTFASASEDMNNSINNIVDFFSSGWVKGIACIMLIGECLGLLFAGGQNPQIFKKFLPFIIGTVLFMCAGKIITLIFGDFGNTQFSDDLKKTSLLLPEDINHQKYDFNTFGNVEFKLS
ncbi:TrbC/VirB2 family protein [Treponema pectinovorum]|uniref:TrbC/VirB2 family protein n=1 Tax=Treponema pectinovorum TaxID=164 RepID=UPI0011F1073D|nr:TrbC/VirB2 family protein [Treponema pectinovorum]